jgi:hypothetical protein
MKSPQGKEQLRRVKETKTGTRTKEVHYRNKEKKRSTERE